ncbi:uncharacterized protein LOC106096161 [Stomoxys calcitrans]|uniref:Secreted protein n=1 Tax=Stomoxys calcitrans TaxID=35570 RepID=A0A1I8P292_STOCA|nr:uncharacterized protein LOC106096161 [Stomoxys calcitrans]XP_013119212.1 uncharacterized protein LOC106096161 [Stomoxys calcitrans]
MAIRKALVVLLISFLCSAHARSVSVVGDVFIEVDADKFRCDKIECPLNAEYCVVTKQKHPNDASVLLRSNTCFAMSGEELVKSVFNEPIDPNTQIQLTLQANRSGGISSINSLNSLQTITTGDFDEEAFNAQMNNFKENFSRGMANLNNGLMAMSNRMQNMFGGK